MNPWVGKIPWRRKWQPTPVFLPGEFHGQRSLVGYSPWAPIESDMTEQRSVTKSYFLVAFDIEEQERIKGDKRSLAFQGNS